ncbi:hypothetical protein D3C71_1991840 [compost metagenome]
MVRIRPQYESVPDIDFVLLIFFPDIQAALGHDKQIEYAYIPSAGMLAAGRSMSEAANYIVWQRWNGEMNDRHSRASPSNHRSFICDSFSCEADTSSPV